MKYDCIVCGGGPAGICASISASRNNAKVLLIEQSGLLGGTNVLSLVGPLMTFHNELKPIIGGIANEIIDRLSKTNDTLGHIPDPLDFCSTITPVDVEALKKLYFDMIEENGVDLLLHSTIVGVEKKEGRVVSVKVANKSGVKDYQADYFIDATGDGDLCSFAGAEYILGRAEDHLCQPMTMPFVLGNVDLDRVRDEMRNHPDNFVLRNDYDFKYVGVSGFFNEVNKAKENGDFAINRDRVLLFEDVKENQVTVNMTRVLKLNGIDEFERTKAEIEGRKQVYQAYDFLKKYVQVFRYW